MKNLFVVATPIGNLKDITYRAIETLELCDAFITENQVTTKKLLAHYKIEYTNKKFFTFAEFNEKKDFDKAIDFILSNENTALVSEAGTPLLSDPGYKIISTIRENQSLTNINIINIPGVSSIAALLSVSGLPTDSFMFVGFLPKKKNKKEKVMQNFEEINKVQKTTFVILESKYKINETIQTLSNLYPEGKISIGRELTKMHEQVIYGNISEVVPQLRKINKGEFILHLSI